jgi:hypothetical protein
MPGVHFVGSTGVLDPPAPVTPVLPVPLLIELPVPEPVLLPVPELAPLPDPLPWLEIEPSHPARSATPTMMLFAQVFIALTSSRYSG